MDGLKNFLAIVGFFAVVIVLAILVGRADLFGTNSAPVPQQAQPQISVPQAPPESVSSGNYSAPVNDEAAQIAVAVETQKTMMTQYAQQQVEPTVLPTSISAPSYVEVKTCTNTVGFWSPVVDNSQTAIMLPMGTTVYVTGRTSDMAWVQIWLGGDKYAYVPATHMNIETSSCAVTEE